MKVNPVKLLKDIDGVIGIENWFRETALRWN
jgi:hypothetical protein